MPFNHLDFFTGSSLHPSVGMSGSVAEGVEGLVGDVQDGGSWSANLLVPLLQRRRRSGIRTTASEFQPMSFPGGDRFT